jgi:hypothetical protein
LFHLRVCYPDTANPIDNIVALSKSDTANQTEEEITQASASEIARTERLARNAEKAIGKKAHIVAGPRQRSRRLR